MEEIDEYQAVYEHTMRLYRELEQYLTLLAQFSQIPTFRKRMLVRREIIVMLMKELDQLVLPL
jgi:hypothetical protein